MNLMIAARSFGQGLEVEIMPKSESVRTLAVIRLQEHRTHPSETDRRLRDAIKTRRTIRFSFDETPVDPDILQELARLAHIHGC